MNDDASAAETPRFEPEIIPPSRAGRRPSVRKPKGKKSADWRGENLIRVTRIGPLWLIAIAVAVLVVVACLVLLVAGALLLWIPIAAATLIGSIIASFLRRPRQR